MSQNRSTAVMQRRVEAHDIVTIEDANALELKWYFTGKPCPRGHIAKRSISNRDCRACVDARKAALRRDEPEVVRAKDRIRHANAIDRRREQARASRAKHIEKRREEDRSRYHADPTRTKVAAVRWSRLNKGKRAAIIAARRMKQQHATPAWLSAEQKRSIRALYVEAANMPGEWHVDHIVPINGRLVCGLHVPWNLQILTGDDNRKKGNRHGPE